MCILKVRKNTRTGLFCDDFLKKILSVLLNATEKKSDRERKKMRHKSICWYLLQTESSSVSFHFQEIFTITKKITNAQEQYNFNAQAHKQKTTNTQSQLKENSHNLT